MEGGVGRESQQMPVLRISTGSYANFVSIT